MRIVCNRIGDFEMGIGLLRLIVTEGMTDVVTLSVFDSAGEFQHTLGRLAVDRMNIFICRMKLY
ncbi:MAG: hypothetical protein ACLU30_02680 [Odoribacter splanchnicus]